MATSRERVRLSFKPGNWISKISDRGNELGFAGLLKNGHRHWINVGITAGIK